MIPKSGSHFSGKIMLKEHGMIHFSGRTMLKEQASS
jgi:hypothetical protein